MEHEVLFDPGANVLSSDEIRNVLWWRDKTRRAFPGGFEAVVLLWENAPAGIPAALARQRAEFLGGLLENLGVAATDIEPPEIRRSSRVVSGDYDVRFLNTGRILLNPRCPHACCDTGDIR